MVIGTILSYGGLALASHFSYLLGGSLLERTGKRIGSQGELESVVNEEAKMLDILNNEKEGLPLLVNYKETNIARACQLGVKIDRDTDKIELLPLSQVDGKEVHRVRYLEFGGRDATRKKVRHELYHQKYHLDGDKTDSERGFLDTLKYLFWNEPTAILYALTGFDLHKYFPKPIKMKPSQFPQMDIPDFPQFENRQFPQLETPVPPQLARIEPTSYVTNQDQTSSQRSYYQ